MSRARALGKMNIFGIAPVLVLGYCLLEVGDWTMRMFNFSAIAFFHRQARLRMKEIKLRFCARHVDGFARWNRSNAWLALDNRENNG